MILHSRTARTGLALFALTAALATASSPAYAGTPVSAPGVNVIADSAPTANTGSASGSSSLASLLGQLWPRAVDSCNANGICPGGPR